MGVLRCKRCRAEAEGSTFEEADELIDHSRGLSIGRPCAGDTKDLVWSGPTRVAPQQTAEHSPEKPKQSEADKPPRTAISKSRKGR